MIKRYLVILALVATAGGLTLSSQAQAEDRMTSLACDQPYDTRCKSDAAPLAGSPSHPLSAAKSDAIKKRQFFEMMRKNQGTLLGEEKALVSSARLPAKKQL